MSQCLIDFDTGLPADYTDGRHRKAFEEFHSAHPEVYAELKARALQVAESGRKVGLRCLLESLRWSWAIGDAAKWWGDAGDQQFKVNGNHQRYYRDMLNREPGLRGFFEVRERS